MNRATFLSDLRAGLIVTGLTRDLAFDLTVATRREDWTGPTYQMTEAEDGWRVEPSAEQQVSA